MQRIVNDIIGIGAFVSATDGDKVDDILAKKFEIPKAVPPKIAGNNYALQR